MGKLNIDLLGASFTIEAKEDNQYLETLLSHYVQITKDVRLMANNADPVKIAILSGLMICDELFKDREKAEDVKKLLGSSVHTNENGIFKEAHETEKITLKMIQEIDRILS